MWGGPWPRIPVTVPTSRGPNKQGPEALTYPTSGPLLSSLCPGPTSPKSQTSPMDQKAGGERGSSGFRVGLREGRRRGCPGEGQTALRPGTDRRVKGL